MVSHHQNAISEHRIKELNLGRRTLLFHATILWPEAVITMLWPLSFKAELQRYNIGQKDARAEVLCCVVPNFPYRLTHLGLPHLCPRSPTVGGDGRATQMKTMGKNRMTFPIYTGSVDLVLNSRTVHVSPQYHVVFDKKILHCGAHEEENSPSKLENPDKGALRARYAGKIHS